MKDKHIVPMDDLIEHTIDADSCVCGSLVELVETAAGDVYIYRHSSLDGRELEERRTGKTTGKMWGTYDG